VTKPKVINFQLARSGVVLVIVGVLVIGVLLVAAGYMAGLAASSKGAIPAPALATTAASATAVSTTAATAATAPPAAATITATTTTASNAPAEEAFSLRVKTFGSEAEAKAEQVALKGKQIESVIITLPPEGGGAVIYSVETGHYVTRAEASAASASLAEKSEVQTAVVPAAPLAKPPG
jgi:cell division septation protein DedD